MATGGTKPALNPDVPAFNMAAMNAAAMAAANAVLARDARLPDFSIEKPEVWFSMVEALFEDCNVTASKKKYNKVLYRLPVNVVESLATLINNIGDYTGRVYQELEKRVLAAHGCSRWEKLDSWEWNRLNSWEWNRLIAGSGIDQ
jgi:hypothetical protein